MQTIDWVVLGVYLLAVLLIGLYASGRQESTRDYFLGGRSLPWWAVALSIIATETSAVTYIGLPGLAYRTDGYYLQIVLGFALGRIFLAFYFIKFFYRFELTTVYGFLERRFGESTRVLGAGMFLVGRVIASAVRLFAACLAVQVVTGLSIELAIGLVTLLGIAYTLLGGIKAVVWTDCILGVTFILGGLLAVVFILGQFEASLGEILVDERLGAKWQIFHPGLGPDSTWREFFASDRPLLIGLLGGFVLTLATHGTDQDLVQRMLTCEDEKGGGRSLIASAFLIVPLLALFMLIGWLLWLLHQAHPELLPVLPEGITQRKEDYYFPLFIVNHLPGGVTGFIFAGVFAAALSSLTSVLNALSATFISDFYRPYLKQVAPEAHYLKASRVATLLWGLALGGLALAFVGSGDNVIAIAMKVLTYFYGSLLGAFLLGMMTRRGNGISMVCGMFLGALCVLALQTRQYLASPEQAPDAVRLVLKQVPEKTSRAILEVVPDLGWPLWIIVGTVVTMAIGSLGSSTIARRSG